ncbi:hypothetical protein BJN34_28400 [Cupriavidus necator]|uniref:Uncharacterized protein n=1 Tax=Cupriavidus necator TaxID=106590 RepID=A0A1U9UYP3_CUPNE|nr:hypothetical protein BJN34_28400 [Cupriavidus necator]
MVAMSLPGAARAVPAMPSMRPCGQGYDDDARQLNRKDREFRTLECHGVGAPRELAEMFQSTGEFAQSDW